MMVWDYNNTTETLTVARYNNGKQYTVKRQCATPRLLAMWLKTLTEYTSIDEFVMISTLETALHSDNS